MKHSFSLVFFGTLLALSAQAQSQDNFDREDFDQPELRRTAPVSQAPAPEGMERLTGTPRIIGFGFKSKGSEHIISVACVGAGTPASCGSLRHLISTGDGKDTFFFGPTYRISGGEPSESTLKEFVKERNAVYKDAKFPRRWRFVAGLGGIIGAFFLPVSAISIPLFFLSSSYLSSQCPPVLTGHGPVMGLISRGDPRWPTMGDKSFTKYMNLVEGNAGNRFKNYLLASGQGTSHVQP